MPRLVDMPTLTQFGDTGRLLAAQGGSGLLPGPLLRQYVQAGRGLYAADLGISAATADNGPAVLAAGAAASAGGPVTLPKGHYPTTLDWQAITAPFRGAGQVGDADGNLRGPNIVAVSAAPSSVGWSDSSVATAFNGDMSAPWAAVEHRITGAGTLGQPATGYYYRPHTAAYVGHLYNTSGWNQATGSNEGRTTAAHMRLKVEQHGQGDCMAIYANASVAGARAGATNFLANPAASILAADTHADADGVYLNPYEINLDDRGHDVAGAGWVVNLFRHNDTGALGTFWAGHRVQSVGTAAADAAFSASGRFRVGIDLSTGLYGDARAALAIGPNQRIYLGCTNASEFQFPDETELAPFWIGYDTDAAAIEVVVNDTPMLRVGYNDVTSTKPLRVDGGANGVVMAPAGGGGIPFVQATGADTHVTLALRGKGAGGVMVGLAADRVGFFGYTPQAKFTVTGSRGGNYALASLLAVLASYGLVIDGSTA